MATENTATTNGELSAAIAQNTGKAVAPSVLHHLEAWKKKHLSTLQEFLGEHREDAERLYLGFAYSVSRSTDLLQCTIDSLVSSLLTCAQLTLFPGPLGEAAILSFNNRVKLPDGKERWEKQAQFVPMYGGLMRLAIQCGGATQISPEIVYEKDDFRFKRGTKTFLDHSYDLKGDRGERLAAYCLYQLPGADEPDFVIVTCDQMNQIKAKSKGAKSSFSPWNSEASIDVDGMWKKTAVKQACKYIPKRGDFGYRLARAIEMDNAIERPDLVQAQIIKPETLGLPEQE